MPILGMVRDSVATVTGKARSTWDATFFKSTDTMTQDQVKASKYQQAHNSLVVRSLRDAQLKANGFVKGIMTVATHQFLTSDESSWTWSFLAALGSSAMVFTDMGVNAVEGVIAATPYYKAVPAEEHHQADERASQMAPQ